MGDPPKRLLDYLFMLTATAKKEAADHLRRMAAELERQAEADARIDQVRANVRRHRQSRQEMLYQVARMLCGGADLAAIRNRFPDWRDDQAHAMADLARPIAQKMATAERNREIVRLARRLTNAELADRFHLSEGQITRIIRAAYRRPKV